MPSLPEPPVVLAQWERFLGWLLQRTEKFPKRVAFTFRTRIDNLALDVFERLVEARYQRQRSDLLRRINLDLEKLRLLLRLAHAQGVLDPRALLHACQELDHTGRMVGGWQKQLALNPRTTRIVPVRDGIPFLGMRVYKALIRVRPGRWQRFVRRQAAIEAALVEGRISEEDAAARLSSQYAHLQTFNTQRLRREHLARRSQAGLGEDHRRLESGEPGRLLGQRRAEDARRQPRQGRAGEPQPEPGLSSFELSAAARPSGLVRGEKIWPEASSLRTATPVPRC